MTDPKSIRFLANVVGSVDIRDPRDLASISEGLSKVTETDLLIWAILGEQGGANTSESRKVIAAARYELARRAAASQTKLTRWTTIVSGAIGIVGTLIGVIVGKYLGV